jgi:GH15 family glucan-1,4-alpha-glucosidase
VFALQQEAMVPPGGDAWWGAAILFVNDDPTDARAALFQDDRSVEDIVALWQAFAGEKDAGTLHQEALDEFEAWRAPTAPSGLTTEERTLWRQSEAVLRMAQVREPRQANRENHGMILAALAPGEWHTGWVRDATYAITSMAMTGHFEEARLGLEFLLGADGATNGLFSNPAYLDNGSYRVSATRYFGNGDEEGDWNSDGPNIETDGWGLTLWAARAFIHHSCDKGWLDTLTWRGDTMFEALHVVAQDIEGLIRSGLPAPDTSIWEVHWNYRQVFAFTAAAHIRGLYDFADIAEWYGRADLASHYREIAGTMLEAVRSSMVYVPDQSIASNLSRAGNPVHVDASTVEFLTWGLIGTDDPLYTGTLENYSRLMTGFGGYARVEATLALAGMRNDTYDTNEWILIDLRVGEAWRKLGRADRADALLDKITRHALVNDHQIPELFEKTTGRYEGVVPMVGYGAGAWMTSQLEKHGVHAPAHDAGFSHCPAEGIDAGRPPVPDGGYVAGDSGFGGGGDGGGFVEDGAASFCAVGSGHAPPGVPALGLAVALAWILRRRAGR